MRDAAAGRRAGIRSAVILAFVAFSGLQCVQDLIGPSAAHHVYTFESVGPTRFSANIGDTLTAPSARLTVDGAPATVGIAVAVIEGASVARADSAGRLVVLGTGDAVLRLRPLSTALSVDTLHVIDTLHAVVPVLAATGPDTVFSLKDTVRLTAHPRTRAGAAIAGAASVWRLTSGSGVVTLLDSTTGTVRAETNGDVVLTGVSDTATVQRTLRVRQRAMSVVPAGAILFHWAGHARQLAPQVKDARANLVASASLTYVSRNTAVATVSGAGLVTAVGDGTTRIVTSASGPGGGSAADSSTVVVQTARLAILSGNSQVASVGATLPLPLEVKLVDAGGATVADSLARVVFRVTAGSGRFAGVDSVVALTDTAGRASASLTLGTAVAPTSVQVTGTGLAGTPVTFTATPAPAARLKIAVQPSAVPAGGSIAPAVKAEVRDTFNTLVPSVPESVSVALAPGTGTTGAVLLGTKKVATSAGVATFPSLTVDKAGVGYRLIVSAAGLSPDTSAAFNVTAGAPDHMVFLAPPLGGRAGVPVFPVMQVKVVDASGNAVPTFTGDVTLSVGRVPAAGSDRYFGTATVSAVAGVASFSDFGIQTAAAGYKLRAASAGLAAILSDLFDVSGAPDTLRLVSGNGQGGIVNAVLADSLVVKVVDASGIGVAGDTVVFRVTAGGGAIGGVDSAVVLTVGGRAAAALKLGGSTGTDTVVVRSKGLVGRTVTFTATAVEAGNRLQFVTQPTTFAVGTSFNPPVQVRVRNGFGQTVTGATAVITLAVASGTGRAGATVTGTVSAPAVGGVATFPAQAVSRSGTGYRLVATATDIASDTSALFDVLQVPATLEKGWGDNQNGTVGTGLGDNFVVRVLDAAGDPIAGDTVVYKVTSGVGTMYGGADSSIAVTDAAGRALAELTLGPTPGTVTVTARSTRIAGQSATFRASATAAGRALQFVTQPANIVAGNAFSPAVQVRVFNPANDSTDATAATFIRLSGYGGTLTGALQSDGSMVVAAVVGVATFSGLGVSGPVGGSKRLIASAQGFASDVGSTEFEVTAGEPARLEIVFPLGTVRAGEEFAEYVRILDANGNFVPNATNPVTLSLVGGTAGAHLRGTLSVAAVNGGAQYYRLSVDSVGAGYALSASSPGLVGVVGPAFMIVPSFPHRLVFGVPPVNVTAGAAMNEIHVFVEDSLGNLAATTNMAVTLTLGVNPGVGHLLGTTSVPVVGGIAAFTDLRLRFPGSGYTLVAATTDIPQVTSGPFDVLTGAASRLAFNVQPTTVLLLQAIAPAVGVEVQDTVGNRVTGSTARVALAITGGTGGAGASLAGTAARDAAAGTAVFSDLSIGTYGADYTLTATSDGLTSAVSNAFDVLSTTSDRLVVTSAPAGASAGASFDVSVEVRNTAGTKVATATNVVTLSITGGTGTTGAHLRGALTAAASGGVATFHVSIDSAGSGYTIAAKSPGLFGGASGSLAILPAGRHHVAFRVQPTSRTAGNVFSPAIQVAVYDSLGNLEAVENSVMVVGVTLGSGAPDATLSGTKGVFVVGGIATFADLSIAKAGTGYSLTAGYSAPVLAAESNTFSIVPGGAASIAITPQDPATLVGAGSTRHLAATAYDAYGNTLTGGQIFWRSLNSGVATVDASGLVTAVGPGQATVEADTGAAVGYAVVTVSVPELAPVNLWAPMATGTTLDFLAVWGTSRSNIYATGTANASTCQDPRMIHLGEDLTWAPVSSGDPICLGGLSGLAANHVFAAGSAGTLRHFDGAGWQALTTGTTEALAAVWAASPADIFAVGQDGTIGHYSLLGAPPVSMPSGATGWLWGVFGTSARNVVAVGQDATILRYDGSTWSRMASSTTTNIYDVWGTSATSLYATATDGVLHWNGAAWSTMTGSDRVHGNGIWGSSDNDVYAVWGGGNIWRYDGSTWSPMSSGTTGDLRDVWGTPDGAVYAVGNGGLMLRGVRGAAVTVTPASPTLTALGAALQLVAEVREPGGASVGGIRFTWTSAQPAVATVDSTGLVTAVANGTVQITATAPGGASGSTVVTVRQEPAWINLPTGYVGGVGGTWTPPAEARDANNHVIAGQGYSWASLNPAIATVDASTGLVTYVGMGQAVIVARAGTATGYTSVHVASPAEPVNLWAPMANPAGGDLTGVWGLSRTSIYAVGGVGLILHYDGAAWSQMASPATGNPQSLGGFADSLVWVGANNHPMLRFDGHTWSSEPDPGFVVEAIGGYHPRDFYMVGSGGAVRRYDGSSWSPVTSGTFQTLLDVYQVTGPLYAVGEAGTILRDWVPQAPGLTTANLEGIWGQPNRLYAVGTGGTILRTWDEGPWYAMTSGTTANLTSVTGTLSDRDVYAVGGGGTILRFDGAAWAPMASGTTANLSAAWTAPDGDVYVVGAGGTILRGIRSATVEVSPATLTALGATHAMEATAREASGAPVGAVPFAWSSDDPSVATVDPATGLVTAVANGTATITAKVPGGAQGSATATVHQVADVILMADGHAISAPTTLAIDPRDSRNSAVDPALATFESLNPAVVTVSSTGLLTPVSAGQATVVVTMPGGATNRTLVTVATPGTTPVNLWARMSAPGVSANLRYLWGASAHDVFAVGDGTILRYDGAGWGSMPSGASGRLSGVWGTSGTNVFAVGEDGVILHYDGTTWAAMTSGTTAALSAIWGTAPNDVYAVGLGTIIHYDGSGWGANLSPPAGYLSSVWGTSRSNVHAVGIWGHAVHFDGSAWSEHDAPTSENLGNLWGTAPTDTYVTGSSGGMFRYDGADWVSSPQPGFPTTPATAVWGTSSADVYLVSFAQLFHNAGAGWVEEHPGTSADLYSMWGTSAGDVFLVGSGGAIVRGVRGATVTVSPPAPTLTAVGASVGLTAEAREPSASVVTGVAGYTWSSSNPAVARVDAALGIVTAVANGSVTITATAPGGASGSVTVTVHQVAKSLTITPAGVSLSGLAATTTLSVQGLDSLDNVITSPEVAWTSLNPTIATVDASGLVRAAGAGQATIVVHAGDAWAYALVTVTVPNPGQVMLWRLMTSGTSAYIRGVWGASATDVIAVGDFGTALHFDGSSWAPMAGQTGQNWSAVWGASANDVFASGSDGQNHTTLMHFDGSAWTQVPSPSSGFLNGLWGASGRDVFAVGTGGQIFHFDGSGWSQMASGTGTSLRAVWGTSTHDVFAVGDGGTILHYDGSTWSTMASGASGDLNGVWGTSPTDVYVAGWSMAFLHFDGTTWSQMSGTASPGFRALWGPSAIDLYGAASESVIRFNGSFWNPSSGSLGAGTLGIWGTSGREVYAVGTVGMIIQGFYGATVTVAPVGPTIVGVGNTQQLGATARDASGNVLDGVTFTWTSDNLSVATVDGTGKVTAVAAGTATITANAPGWALGSSTVTVSP